MRCAIAPSVYPGCVERLDARPTRAGRPCWQSVRLRLVHNVFWRATIQTIRDGHVWKVVGCI